MLLLRLIRLCLLCVVLSTIPSCILDNPVSEVPVPSEFDYNYWLLSHWYLHNEEIKDSSFYEGKVENLYKNLSDPYTQYIPPIKSEEIEGQINTSIVAGDIGVELLLNTQNEYPLFIYRVYPSSPASNAEIERYSTIISINGIDLKGNEAYTTYQKELSSHKNILLTVKKNNVLDTFSLKKENVLIPTIFLDTINSVLFISIETFKPYTWDQVNGSLGEMRSILEKTKEAPLRILDLRNNLGGHLNQCTGMADLFVSEGILSTRTYKQVNANGETTLFTSTDTATSGDPGEQGDFLLFVNHNTASCGEIFTAAVAENRSFTIIGEKTYGKGVGQNTWKTKDNGLAIITNMFFKTPNGLIYNKQGIQPDVVCDQVSYNCIFDYINTNALLKAKTKNSVYYDSFLRASSSSSFSFGGAIEYILE